MFRSTLPLTLAALLLGGCAVGPDFKLPGMDLGNGWFNAPTSEKTAVLPSRWWTDLNDPVLDALVDQALAHSPTMQSAAARVVAARAQRLQAQSDFAPTVDATGNASYAKNVANPATPNAYRTGNLFNAGFDASWELDIFGGKRRAAEAARANLAAVRADYADARLSLIADVVSAYTDYRLAEDRIALTEATIAAQQKTADLTEARLKAGDTNGLDAAQANSLLATSRAALPALRQQKELARGTLAVLVGALPTSFTVSTGIPVSDTALPSVPTGLPSTLLERRPDIIMAQQNLRGANARIGTAEAARFPTFSLTAALGVQSRILGDLLTSGNDFWSLGPSVGLPLFDAGARRAVVKQRKAEYDEYEAAYTQAILNALREVEAGLTNVAEERQRAEELKAAAGHSQRAADIADALYKAGEQSLLPVLDAQRSLYSSQDSLAQSRASLIQNWVALVKALGGGYVAPKSE